MKDQPINAIAEQLKTKQLIKEDLGRTRRNLKALALTEADLQGIVNEVAVDAAQQTYMSPESPLSRTIEGKRSVSQMRPVMVGDWLPQAVLKENTKGKEMMVWKVRNQRSGKMVEHNFRHEIVANTAAAILNESNTMQDARLVRILDLCSREESVMLEMRQSKRIAESSDDAGKRKIAQNKLEENKLLLTGIRTKLGVR